MEGRGEKAKGLVDEVPFKVNMRKMGLTAPFRLLVTGPTCCGKSRFIAKLLEAKHRLFDKEYDFIGYYYPVNGMTRSRRDYIENLKSHTPDLVAEEGLPSIEEMIVDEDDEADDGSGKQRLIILDDLYAKIVNNAEFQELMEIHSHHSNISVIVTAQNVFQRGKNSTSIMRNYSDIVIFDSKVQRDAISILSRQLFPGRKSWLVDCMDWLRENVSHPVDRYIWIDNHPMAATPESLRVRSRIIPQQLYENHCDAFNDFSDVQYVFSHRAS